MVCPICGILISTTAIAEYQGNPAVNTHKSWLGWAETTYSSHLNKTGFISIIFPPK
ncbi:MAG: hypothetical protein V7K69_00195 [Nostoc sp.]|uniref:hypothetical protein n=1 Tax=Nostoc sp. TaxID=1180 RepID=UPI002FFB7C93